MNLQDVKNLGWRVTFAGMGINLALGVLYSWSVIKKEIPAAWGWSDFEKTLPYSLACLIFALVMVPAGRAQDRIGPRWVALAGGLAVGLGMVLAGLSTSVAGFVAGFGVLVGAGLGMGYAAATPAALKWFPPQRTGLIAGLVVAGFGLASVYISPLAKYLIGVFSVATPAGTLDTGPGVQKAMIIFGVGFAVGVGILSQFLVVPPPGWKAAVPAPRAGVKPAVADDYTWMQMLATSQFYLLWLMYAAAAGAGLMIIANLAPILKLQAHTNAGFLFVAILAAGNAGGRVLAGMLSDRIGRRATLILVFLLQAVLMFILARISALWAFVGISVLLGANYGANLALFPAVTKDYYGIRNFGVNYGWVFTAWGVGGLVLSQIAGAIRDRTDNYNLAYLIAGVCLVVAAGIAMVLRAPRARDTATMPADPSASPALATGKT